MLNCSGWYSEGPLLLLGFQLVCEVLDVRFQSGKVILSKKRIMTK